MRTLMRELVIAKQRREDEHDRDVTLAWTVEALRRTKRLPALKTLFAKRSSERQTSRQLRTTLQLLSEAYRIPLRTKTKTKGQRATTSMKASRG